MKFTASQESLLGELQFLQGVAEKKKTIDVGFSGILRNEYVPELQGDLRRDLMKEIF